MSSQKRRLNILEALSNENVSRLSDETGLSRQPMIYAKERFRERGNLSTKQLDLLRWLAVKQDLDLWYLIFNEDRPDYETLKGELS